MGRQVLSHLGETLAQHHKQDNPFTTICSVFSIAGGTMCSIRHFHNVQFIILNPCNRAVWRQRNTVLAGIAAAGNQVMDWSSIVWTLHYVQKTPPQLVSFPSYWKQKLSPLIVENLPLSSLNVHAQCRPSVIFLGLNSSFSLYNVYPPNLFLTVNWHFPKPPLESHNLSLLMHSRLSIPLISLVVLLCTFLQAYFFLE